MCRIIHESLGYRKVCARWVPRMLTPDMMKNRETVCAELLQRYDREGEAFLRRVLTGDESWVHHYDPESKRQSMEYRHKDSPTPIKFKMVASAGKVMITVFWDRTGGVVLIDFLEHGDTINSARYVDTLRKLRARVARVRPGLQAILQHDNARPHTSRETQAGLQALRFTEILPHPPYSPDLAPCDFFLFPRLKEHLKGQRFSGDAEVKAAVRKWCRVQSADFFADGIRQLVHRWRVCVDKKGNYVEK